MKKLLAEIAGWYGAITIVGAYVLISTSLVSASSIWYQLLNLSCALVFIAVSCYKRVFQSVILNIIWVLVAVVSLLHR
jgi:hypothetical protein